MSDGFYLFKLRNYDAGQVILDGGPWLVHGHPLVLQRWTEDIEMFRQTFETTLVWVHFPNLNFCFRTRSALSKIASVIGKPICMDHATAAGTRFAFARVCIEVGIDADYPAEICMKYRGKTIVQKVGYAWKPNPCKACNTFDVGDGACPLKVSASKPKQIWVPKKTTTTLNEPLEGSVNDHGEWNIVKEKSSSGPPSSPKMVLNRSASPKKNDSGLAPSSKKVNRFSNLSNLHGESNASLEELAETTSLVLDNSVIADDRHIPSMIALPKSLSSIHHLDKNLIPKMAASSSSAKNKPVSTGIVIKEKGNKNRSS